MLQHYDEHGGYGWHYTDIAPNLIEVFLENFVADPELTFEEYFGWKPQERKANITTTTTKTTVAKVLSSNMILLDDDE
jgi:hypothetical protein